VCAFHPSIVEIDDCARGHLQDKCMRVFLYNALLPERIRFVAFNKCSNACVGALNKHPVAFVMAKSMTIRID
jgi:hypothetical protein